MNNFDIILSSITIIILITTISCLCLYLKYKEYKHLENNQSSIDDSIKSPPKNTE